MSELLKCRCGSDDIAIKVFGDDVQEMRAECSTCGRASVWRTTDEAAITSWNVDRLAEEKAREALGIAAARMQRLLDQQEHCGSYEHECPLHDAHKDYDIAGELPKLREALRLLEER